MARISQLLPLVVLAACSSNPSPSTPASPYSERSAPPSAPPTTGEDIVRAMRERYTGKWYKTLTFVQKTSFANGNVQTWYEAVEIPGKLRIDITPLDSMNAIVFKNDTILQFRAGKLQGSRPFIHPLMVLGFDVYLAPFSETVQKLRALGFDLSKLRQDTWQGRPTYVVGADAGDLKTDQFWVDKEHLYFVRLIEPSQQDSTKTAETQFNKYVRLGGGWIAPEVVFLLDGKETLREEYSDMRADVPLPASLFAGSEYTAPGWVR